MSQHVKTSLMFILTGVIALAAGLFFTISGNRQVARDTESATATVIRYVEGSEYDSTTQTTDTVYYPVVSFEVNGEQVESQYSQYDYNQVYRIGESVTIRYNPENPEEFYIAEEKGRFQFGTAWEIPLGVVLLLIGLGRIFVPAWRAR